ncbi:hypothetical protein Dsin_001301 [Dipteronia sinensis]|uniref:Methyltransferase type 11 domain-containing protein n=1 Tax=Dipteronia sinensis TaxID=43782 RepID=A0AAE0EK65_9ROSI|nr:hypothetical protein Dsin_001301 [Dipteronia sinensis]
MTNALEQPFPDGQFDLVWSIESGEHMPDKKKDIKAADWSQYVTPFWPAVILSALTWNGLTSLLRSGLKTIKGAFAMPLMIEGYKKDLIKFSIITCRKPRVHCSRALPTVVFTAEAVRAKSSSGGSLIARAMRDKISPLPTMVFTAIVMRTETPPLVMWAWPQFVVFT